MTTAQFSAEATRYAESTKSPRVVLVDGRELADLMIDYGVGVTVRETYPVHRVDADYFSEDSDII